MLTEKEQLMKKATWLCCPMCDEDKCVGRYNCKEIQAHIDKKLKEKENEQSDI